MPYLNGFEAYIKLPADGDGDHSENEVEFEILEEYDVSIDEERREAACWVPAEAGQAFTVGWKSRKGRTQSRGDVFVDGRGLRVARSGSGGAVYRRFRTKMGREEEEFCVVESGVRLVFSEAGVACDAGDASPVGQIEIRIYKCRRPRNKKNKLVQDNQSGTETGTPAGLERVATFLFKYRTLDFLRAHGHLDSNETMDVEDELDDDDGGAAMSVDAQPGGEQAQVYEPGWSTCDIEDPSLRAEIELVLAKTPREMDAEISELNARLNKLHAMKETRRRLTSKGNKLRRPAFVYEIMGKKRRREKAEGRVSRREKIKNRKAAKALSGTQLGEEGGSQVHVQAGEL